MGIGLINFSQLFYSLIVRSSRPEVFLGKGVQKICSKFTIEHPWQSAISIKLQSNFIGITLRHGFSPVNLLQISKTTIFRRTPVDGWFWIVYESASSQSAVTSLVLHDMCWNLSLFLVWWTHSHQKSSNCWDLQR